MSQMVVTFRKQLAKKKGRFSVAVPALLRQHGGVCGAIPPLLCLPYRQHQFQFRGILHAVQTFPICLIAAVSMVAHPSGLHIVLLLRPWTSAQIPIPRFKGGTGRPHRHRTISGVPSDHGVWTQAQRSLLPPQPLTKLVGVRLFLMRCLGKLRHIFLDRINPKHILGQKHSLMNKTPPLHPRHHARMASASRLLRASSRQMAHSPPHLRQLS